MRMGGLLALIIAGLSAQPLAAQTSTQLGMPKAACNKPENRQFDFWIGRWRAVETKTGKPAGRSYIEKLYSGCTIRENWVDPDLTGGSLNTFVARDGKWHQTWTDSAGTWREYVGGIVDGKMVLVWTHPSFRDSSTIVQERVTLNRNPDGTVRQYSDVSRDGGSHWNELYDYTYHRVRK